MNSKQWNASSNPLTLLRCLSGKMSDRKRRLLGVACCRSVWFLLVHKECRKSVEMAERYADGKGTEEDLAQQEHSAVRAYQSACFASQDYPIKSKDNPFSQLPVRNITRAVEATKAVMGTVDPHLGKEGQEHFSIDEIVECVVGAWGATVAEAYPEATLVREIFGDPFRPVKAEPEWLTSDVVALARDIYAKRAFDQMGILADALQDAGCDNSDVLSHLYEPMGEHVRGCWVADMLLGKG
jgi:hypothetical protein